MDKCILILTGCTRFLLDIYLRIEASCYWSCCIIVDIDFALNLMLVDCFCHWLNKMVRPFERILSKKLNTEEKRTLPWNTVTDFSFEKFNECSPRKHGKCFCNNTLG
jgi:hypothetical protein